MPGFHIENFGCRAARADGEAIASQLLAAGHCAQKSPQAEVVVVNTCSVTAEADRAARAFIRRAHRVNPDAKIVVTGCYAQRAPEELAGMAGVAAVVGNSHKALAPEIVLGLARRDVAGAVVAEELVPVAALVGGIAPVWADDRFAHSFLEEAQVVPGAQTRPNLKIQEGCGNRCTFCVIPQTRGSSRSLPRAAVMRQVEGFVAAGGKELVLSGINLGRWGRDLVGEEACSPTLSAKGDGKDGAREGFAEVGQTAEFGQRLRFGQRLTFSGLVREILEQTTLPRLRISSVEPMDWDADLVELMAEFGGTRLARHAHLPLQSGSDAVLRRMHRRYRPWHYADKVAALLRAAGPELTLGADVMVGFPGETDVEFEETVAMVRALPFGYLHLFPFSPRPGTAGWALHAANPVPHVTVDERMAALRQLAAEKARVHRSQFVGRELEAITLHTPAEMAAQGRTAALTENFLGIELAGELQGEVDGEFEANRLVRVRVTGLKEDGGLAGWATNARARIQ